MLARDYLDDVLGAFRKQRLRTALTAAGIGVGAFAITLMVALGYGLQSYLEQQLRHFGSDRVLVVTPREDEGPAKIVEMIASLGRPAKPISEDEETERRSRRGGLWIAPGQVRALRKLEGVESVSPMTWLDADGIALKDDVEGDVVFFETDFLALSNSQLVGTPSAGRKPAEEAPDEVLLAPQYAESWGLEPEALIGRRVAIRSPKLEGVNRRFLFRDPTNFKEEHRDFEATVVGLAERSPFSRAVYGSTAFGREVARFQSGNPELLSDEKFGFQAMVRLKDGVDPAELKARIEPLGLSARSLNDSVGELRRIFLVVDSGLMSFGLLALVVATLGIANTLFMAITERTREIGVMKALGATGGTIRKIFAAEALGIGLAGGIAGTAAALVLGLAANAVIEATIPAASGLGDYSAFVYPPWLLAGAPLFCAAIGVLAGLLPAARAAGLDPVVALRRE